MNNFKINKNTKWKEVDINGEVKQVPMDWEVDSIEKSIVMEKNTKNSQILNSLILKNGRVPVVGQEVEFISGYTNNITPLVANKENPTIIFGDHSCTLKFITFNYALGGDGTKVFKGNQEIKTNFLFYSIKNLSFNTDGYKRHFSILKEKLINIPPLSQQSSIASILSTQESIINDMETLVEKYETRLRYLSEELLSGRLRIKEVDGKIVFYKNTEWKEVEINGEMKEIPVDWEVEKLDNLITCLDNKRKPLNQTERASKKGNIPYWGANSIVDYIQDYLIDDDVILLGEDAAPFYDKSKKVSFLSYGKIWPNNHIHVLKALRNIANSYFLMLSLNMVKYEKIIGVDARPKLTQGMMKAIEISTPSLHEQYLLELVLSKQELLITLKKELLDAEKNKFIFLLNNLLSGNYLIETIA